MTVFPKVDTPVTLELDAVSCPLTLVFVKVEIPTTDKPGCWYFYFNKY